MLFGHGWIFLAPHVIGADGASFERPLRLSSGRRCHVRFAVNHAATITGHTEGRMSSNERREMIEQCRYILRLDERLDGFHRQCLRDDLLAALGKRKAGRLLRSPTVFEDVVKTICTTNCSWANTKSMVERLCVLGGGDFPNAPEICRAGLDFLINHVRAGYRAAYILSFAEQVASGDIDLSEWRASPGDPRIVDEIRNVRGVGPYALNHILMLLGRYDIVPVDSEVIAWLRRTHHRGRQVSEKTALRRYERYGMWKFLAYKLERIALRSNYAD